VRSRGGGEREKEKGQPRGASGQARSSPHNNMSNTLAKSLLSKLF
jgi:hypothetical protein